MKYRGIPKVEPAVFFKEMLINFPNWKKSLIRRTYLLKMYIVWSDKANHSQIFGGGLSSSLWNIPAVGESGDVILLDGVGASRVSVVTTFPLKLTGVCLRLLIPPLFCTRVIESESPFPLLLLGSFRKSFELAAVWLGGTGGSTRQQGSATGYWVWCRIRAWRLG